MRCKVCGDVAEFFAKSEVLGKYPVSYYRCASCGFIQTEEPYWLDEAYSEAITKSDTGLVRRNLSLAMKTRAIISAWFNPARCFLDFGGGSGLLVRLMRDAGFDFRLYDKHCNNLFARGFEATVGDPFSPFSYELVTAFEVLEHLSDPLAEITPIASHSRNILFSTEIIPRSLPLPESWWYYGLDHGQHISFYSLRALEVIGRKLSLNFYTNGVSLHLFTDKKLPSLLFRMSTYNLFAVPINTIFRRKSLMMEDCERMS